MATRVQALLKIERSRRPRARGELAPWRLKMNEGARSRFVRYCAIGLSLGFTGAADAQVPLGNLTAERPALGSTIRVETSARFGASVSSVTFRGRQYVDSRDHGRELQSASSFDGLGECFNPTEAGSVADGDKLTTSTKILAGEAGPGWIKTRVDMAFWLPPNYDYKKQCGMTPTVTHSMNKGLRGGHILDKRIDIGERELPNVIVDNVTYTVPEAHGSATFEAATWYTPKDFSKRYTLNPDTGALQPTTTFGEQQFPVILATEDGGSAVGVFSRFLPQGGRGYGTFSFPDTNKINCVFREKPIGAGKTYSYVCDFAIGTLEEVKRAITELHRRPAGEERERHR